MARDCILVVDDEPGILELCARTLAQLPDTQVVVEAESELAAKRLEGGNVDLLITDMRMPRLSGLELLRRARQKDPHLQALILTGYPSVEMAVECMKLGAADYITKPFSPPELEKAARRLLEERRLREENVLLRRQIERPFAGGEILGQTPAMKKVCESVQRAAATNFDVLIIGETGTGKELVAHAIHKNSRRKAGPFVPVDCGAIPEDLMESEFFGHERGAFTGAQTRSLGLMEFANSGTFFMDEIPQMPPRLQAKLLRVLQERRIRRVGGTEEIPLDIRVLVASSVSLQEAVERHHFRMDLYHRINVVRIQIPPLRERVADIPLLARHFLDRACREMERAPMEITSAALEVLAGYPWPGNVRELQNAMKRIVALADPSVISVDDLPDDIVALGGHRSQHVRGGFFAERERRLGLFERDYLRNLLAANQGDVVAAISQAGLPRGTFYRLLKKHALTALEFRAGSAAGPITPVRS